MKRRRLEVALAVGLVGIAISGVTSGTSEAKDDQQAVLAAVVNGLNVSQNAISVQPKGERLPPVLMDLEKVDQGNLKYLELPSDYSEAMAATHTKIDAYLTGDENKKAHHRVDQWLLQLPEVERGLTAVSDDPREFALQDHTDTISYILTSGAEDFVFDDVAIADRTAVARGTTLLWSSGVAVGPDEFQIYSPQETWSFEVRLEFVNSAWKVSWLDLAPHYAPDAAEK